MLESPFLNLRINGLVRGDARVNSKLLVAVENIIVGGFLPVGTDLLRQKNVHVGELLEI